MNASRTFTVIVATILFACTIGVLAAVGMFGVVRMFEQMGEGLGFLSARWAENNFSLMVEISIAVAIPVALWFILWFYRKAVKAEAALAGYAYKPPSTGAEKG